MELCYIRIVVRLLRKYNILQNKIFNYYNGYY